MEILVGAGLFMLWLITVGIGLKSDISYFDRLGAVGFSFKFAQTGILLILGLYVALGNDLDRWFVQYAGSGIVIVVILALIWWRKRDDWWNRQVYREERAARIQQRHRVMAEKKKRQAHYEEKRKRDHLPY